MFNASPIFTVLRILMLIIISIVPSGINALVTANFIDTATEILQGFRLQRDIILPLILLIAIMAIVTTMSAMSELVNARIKMDLQNKLEPVFTKRIASLEYKHIENNKNMELISRVSRDPAGAIISGFGGFVRLLEIILGITSVLVIIATTVWWAVLIIISFSIPMVWLSMYAGKKNYQAGREAEIFNRRNEYLGSILTNRECVDERTIFNYGDEINKRWCESYNTSRILQLKVNIKTAFITKGSSVILALVALLIALTLINPVLTGSLSAGLYIGIEAAVFGLVRTLGGQLIDTTENISHVNEYMKDLTEFLELSNDEKILDLPENQAIDIETIEFCNVKFKYPNNKEYILKDVSFILESGQHYAFVGENGQGKTTIIKLLTGLYTDYEGKIMVNKKEIREYPASVLKASFSVVYQDFAKYYISLRENVTLGDVVGRDTSKRLSNVIDTMGLKEVIDNLKDGMNTPLGKIVEGGQDISGGQWQKVAIARSLFSKAPVRILDEPTAALDPISESKVYDEFETLMRGKTTIFISHRLGSTKLADEILVIHNGYVTEKGNHHKLMNLNGKYAAMFDSQRRWYE